MSGFLSKKTKIVVAAGLLAFVMVAMLRMGSNMKTNKNGDMEGCIFLTGKVMLCKMGPLEHINLWQKMFTAVPGEIGRVLMAFSLAVVLSFAIGRAISTISSLKIFALQKLYLLQHIELLLFNPLRLAFAKGILNPKIYDSAVI